jgi:Uma2 family endonuclease
MATAALKKANRPPRGGPLAFGREANGIKMTPQEFDRAEFAEGWVYELVNGVLIVSSTPSIRERDPNQALGRWLLNYQESHPQGSALDFTIHEHVLVTGLNRRRADRVLWAGLGRLPGKDETPTILVEFVSEGKRNLLRDYESKRDEYMAIGVSEYWIIDRFQRTLTVFSLQDGKIKERVVRERQTYKTPLLPGFDLPLARLLALADRWPDEAL